MMAYILFYYMGIGIFLVFFSLVIILFFIRKYDSLILKRYLNSNIATFFALLFLFHGLQFKGVLHPYTYLASLACSSTLIYSSIAFVVALFNRQLSQFWEYTLKAIVIILTIGHLYIGILFQLENKATTVAKAWVILTAVCLIIMVLLIIVIRVWGVRRYKSNPIVKRVNYIFVGLNTLFISGFVYDLINLYRGIFTQSISPFYVSFAYMSIVSIIFLYQSFKFLMYQGSFPIYIAPDPSQIEGFGITKRENEVLALVLNGLSNEDISRHLFISLATVKQHVSSIFSKCHVNSRMQLSTVFYKKMSKIDP